MQTNQNKVTLQRGHVLSLPMYVSFFAGPAHDLTTAHRDGPRRSIAGREHRGHAMDLLVECPMKRFDEYRTTFCFGGSN